ncbi:hypothetical protein PAXINDRAFT_172818 [Paxillus involutus ATCC 200175]|uniref:Protein kinase domain-containing protein n=1 Tax=Paxillus involutus ATCC 200175 TaxID=664439 RepID=A0A0C9SP68_PAXIN|nr:hypothetical protein PAXINDRAFT_172818 [Paxillus involutus ATCC 200175]
MHGVIRWAAPETLFKYYSSVCSPTEQTDIYSFGRVMLQVCSGKVPYANLKRDAQVLVALGDTQTPPRPTTPWMNDRMWDFIQRCWSTEEQGTKRPFAEEALNFIQEEIVLSYLCLLPFFDESE